MTRREAIGRKKEIFRSHSNTAGQPTQRRVACWFTSGLAYASISKGRWVGSTTVWLAKKELSGFVMCNN